jgi:uncharacterized protein YndB with AHSA1/START domain
MTDFIRKTVDLKASLDVVWAALTDHEQFGAWFRVRLDGPFVVGEVSTGRITYEGYEHLPWAATIVEITPRRRFAFNWAPYAVDPAVDYSTDPHTLVVFELEPLADGVRLTVTESGFDRLPPGRRDEAFRSNEGGWAIQTENIKAYVEPRAAV